MALKAGNVNPYPGNEETKFKGEGLHCTLLTWLLKKSDITVGLGICVVCKTVFWLFHFIFI